MSDRITELLRGWADGDEEAFEELVAHVRPWVRGLASRKLARKLRGKLDSEDAAQDAIVGFLRDAPRFVVESEGQLFALLAKIVERVIIGHDRYFDRKRRELARERPIQPGTSVDLTGKIQIQALGPASEAARAEEESLVRLALEMLDPIDQRVLCMRSYDGASFEEIAEALDMSEEAVRKRFRRAMPKLAHRIDCLREGNLDGFVADEDG